MCISSCMMVLLLILLLRIPKLSVWLLPTVQYIFPTTDLVSSWSTDVIFTYLGSSGPYGTNFITVWHCIFAIHCSINCLCSWPKKKSFFFFFNHVFSLTAFNCYECVQSIFFRKSLRMSMILVEPVLKYLYWCVAVI